MKLLVTGGAGFVGHHIAQRFLNHGHEVVVLDDLRMGVNLTPRGCTLRVEDIEKDYHTPEKNIDAVIHCAARADVSANWEHISQRWDLLATNICGTTNLLEQHPGVPFIFMSTCAVYGDTPDNHAATEQDPIICTSPYAASKFAGEGYIQAYAHRHQTPWHVFRLGCVVGSGYHHGHVADMVRMAKKANTTEVSREGAVTIHGPLHMKNDGLIKKSFSHVDDVAHAVMMAINGNLPSGVYNLGSALWSWRDTLRTMERMAHHDIPFTFENRKHGWVGDPMAVCSWDKYCKVIGLKVSDERARSSIESGVEDALRGLGWPQ